MARVHAGVALRSRASLPTWRGGLGLGAVLARQEHGQRWTASVRGCQLHSALGRLTSSVWTLLERAIRLVFGRRR